MATLLIRFTQSPYGSAASHDGLDFALAATNYGHDVKVLFEKDAVLQLVKTEAIAGVKTHSKRLSAMPFFDIEDCYVCEESAKALHLSRTIKNCDVVDEVDAQWVNSEARLALINSVDHVVTF